MALRITSTTRLSGAARTSRSRTVCTVVRAHGGAPSSHAKTPSPTRCNSAVAPTAATAQSSRKPKASQEQQQQGFLTYLSAFFQGSQGAEQDEWTHGLSLSEHEHGAGHGHGMYISHLAERMAVEPPSK